MKLTGKSYTMNDILFCSSSMLPDTDINKGRIVIYDYECNIKFEKAFNDYGISNLKAFNIDNTIYYSYLKSTSRHLNRVVTGCYPSLLEIVNKNFDIVKSNIQLLPNGSINEITPADNHDYKIIDINHYYLIGQIPTKVSNIPGIDHEIWILNSIIQEQKNDKVVWQFETKDYPELYNLSLFRNNYMDKKYLSVSCDYAHLNSFDITADNKYLYLSYRNIGVIKVEKETKKIVTYVCHKLNEQYFIGQHDLRLLDDNTFTIFNNNALYTRENVADRKSQVVVCKLQDNTVVSYTAFDTPTKAGCSLGGAILLDIASNIWDIVYSPFASKTQIQEYNFITGEVNLYWNFSLLDPYWCYRIERAPSNCTY